MRVLHVVTAYPSPGNPHAQMFIKTQVESLRDLGVDCDVLVLRGDGWRQYVTGRRQVRGRLETGRYDLIHAHSISCGAMGIGQGVPLVTAFLGSDLYLFPWHDGNENWFDRSVHRTLCRFVARRSAQVIVKSPRMQRDLGLPAQVVPNGVDFSRFRPVGAAERSRIRRDLGLNPGTLYAVFGADPARPRKRFSLAMEAAASATARLGRPLAVLPVFGQAHDTVARHLQACDLLLHTSNLEGSPNIVKEAMASNLPIVSTDVGDVLERLRGVAGCRVVPVDDPADALGAVIAELIESGAAPAGRSAVAPLRLEAVAARVLAIYRDALPGAAAVSGGSPGSA